MTNVMQDVRYALRTLRKSPGFAIVAIFTLAIGIGASTSIFSLLDQILLRRLPVQKPEQLVVLRSPGHTNGRSWSDGDVGQSFSYPMFKALREKNEALSGLLARYVTGVSVSYHGDTEIAECELVSGNYFEVLGVRPALGRVFSMSDEQAPGANPVVIVSYGYWQRHFGGSPQILNQSVGINGIPMTIVGVSQQGFAGVQIGQSPDVFLPLSMTAQAVPNFWDINEWNDYFLPLIGRMKPGMSMKQAEASLQVTYHALVEQQAAMRTDWPSEQRRQQFIDRKLLLMPGAQGRPTVQRDARPDLLALGGMVILVLLIVCTNVASLLMARGATRSREFAVRRALGAERSRLVRAVLIESLLLSLCGGLAGLLVAVWGINALVGVASAAGGGIEGLSSSLDARILAFNFIVAVGVGILFGIAPALRFSSTDLSAVMRDQDRGSTRGAGHVRIRKIFVTAQMALTVLLLSGAAMMTQTLWNLRAVDLGLKADRVLQFRIAPSLNGYTPQRATAFMNQLMDALSASPGVRGASLAEIGLLTGSDSNSGVEIEGKRRERDAEEQPVSQDSIGPNFFSTLGVPLLTGREFAASDTADSPKVAIVNETFVRKYLADRNPIGAHFGFGTGNAVKTDIEIVGVVKNQKYAHVREEDRPFAFMPFTQDKTFGDATLYVRASQSPASLSSAVREAVKRIDSSLPVSKLETEQAIVNEDLSGEAIVAGLSLTFGSVAALLGCVGIYGVLAFLVVQRTREIGIRIALGALHGDIRGLVLREAIVLVAIGVAIGVPAAYGLGRLMDSMLYGVHPGQPLMLLAGPALMAVVALAAAYIPARRATQVDPMVALRYE